MAFLRGIYLIFATTPNFLSGFLMHVSPKTRKIRFRGSHPIEMTSYEYYCLKLPVFRGYSVNKYGDEWEFSKGDIRLRATTDTFSYVLWDDWMFSHYQPIDFKGKTVLDVGGYIGDTAVLFHHLGAKKIVIYEPVEEHMPIIKKNIELNHINAEVKNLGVGRSRGTLEVQFSRLGLCFGRAGAEGDAPKKKTIVLEDIKNVILESSADIAKFNCEGCEEAILSLDPEIIRRIPLYVIEMHSEDLDKRLHEKFAEAGYENIRTTRSKGKSPLHTLKKV